MSTEENNSTRTERLLAYSALTIIVLAIVSFFATLIAALVGVDRAVLAAGFWPVVTWFGYIGMPIGFVLIITLIVLTRHRRKRDLVKSQR